MARKSKVKAGSEAETSGKAMGSNSVPSKSFDSELDALFKAAGSSSQAPSKTASNGHVAKPVIPAASSEESDSQEDSEDEEADGEENGDLSSIESDAVISGISEDESEAERVDNGEQIQSIRQEESEEEEEREARELVHETVLNPSLLTKDTKQLIDKKDKAVKRKAAAEEEPQAVRDARSLFIGNLPVQMATSRSSIRDLKKHLISCSPYPTITQVESIRFRSIPFSKPTDDFEARNPDEADEKQRKRQRSQSYKDKLNEEAERKGMFLSGSQKRKVAYIKQDINDKADSLNAYVTLSPIKGSVVSTLKEQKDMDVSALTAPALAAILAVSVNGTLFEERHLRADLVVPLLPADILASGLTTVKTADGSLLGASAGATSIDNESRKRTVFVGNLDFEAKEEELRGFFEALLTREMGSPPQINALDFSASDKLPPPEERSDDEQVKSLPAWVLGVRIIRDAATQMGKGFGYVRFLNASCVDEIMAMHETEQNALAAIKTGKPLHGEFRRKLKFKARPLRVSRCKVSKGNVTTSSRPTSSKDATPKRPTIPIPHRSRSSDAPTPGGTSPFVRKQQQQQQQQRGFDSPTRKGKSGKDAAATVPNPKPQHSDPLKTARNAQKRADAARQAKRMEKKNRKRAERGRGGSEGDATDKSKVHLKMAKKGGSSSNGKKSAIGRIGKLAAISMMTIVAALFPPSMANNAINNFGPVLCRADEVGHLEDKVARQVSQSWPVLSPASEPTLFSINPTAQPEGVWLVVSFDSSRHGEVETKPIEGGTITPESLSTQSFPLLTTEAYDTGLTPRDRWLRNMFNWIRWTLFNRYTFRVNWSPNFPIDVDIKVLSAREMLVKGNIKWTANEKDMKAVQEEDDLGGIDVPLWPCPRLYLHLSATEFGVPIPPAMELEGVNRLHKAFNKLVEAYIGPLVSQAPDYNTRSATPIPVHLVLEPLLLGVLPETALTFLGVLLPVLALTTVFVLPRILRFFRSIAREAPHLKAE